MIFDAASNAFLVGEPNKTGGSRETIPISDQQLVKQLQQLVALRVGKGRRWLFEKERSKDDRGNYNWYTQGFKATMKKVFGKNMCHTAWRQSCSMADTEAARGDPEKEKEVHRRYNHNENTHKTYYDVVVPNACM